MMHTQKNLCSTPPKSLFWIDDDEDELYLINRLIPQHWPLCQYRLFNDPLEALDILQKAAPENMPQMLITDLNMPSLSGLELLFLLRKKLNSVHTEIRILSGVIPTQEALVSHLEEMPLIYIEKPFSLSSLFTSSENPHNSH